MAPLRAAHQSPSEVIKRSLSSESCSSSTVDLLMETLSPKSSTSSLATSRSRSSRQTAAKTSARARPATTSNCGGVGLSIVERSRLAVEVINATLRSLSDTTKAAKSPSRQESREEASPKGSLKPRKTDRHSTKVLRSRSSNRNDSPSQTPDSVDYLTSCCSIAISFLISIESSDGVPDMIPLQTENARLSLSSKLIQLERFEAAMQELKMLKRRLQLLMQLAGSIESWVVEGNETKNAHYEILGKPRTKLEAPGKENTTELDTTPEKEDPSKLLEFATISSSSAFPLVISCQLAMMRCISGLKRPDLIECILPSFSSQSSPIALIRSLGRSSAAKAVVHFTTLSQIFGSLAPSSAPAMDSLAVNDGISCAPKTAFILRSLQVECLATQQALHPGDRTKDMWEVFIKGLAAFVRRTQTRDAKYKRDRYALSRDIVEKARIMLNARGADSLPSEIYRLMSWIAMDANLIQEAIRWTEYWLKFLNVNEASATALSVLCKVRLATIEVKALRVVLQDNAPIASDALLSLENKVGCAIEGLQNVARGKKQELQLLLQEVGQLRRSGLGILAPVMDEGCNHGDSCTGSVAKGHIPSETRRRLRSISDNIIKGVIHFCRKYVSMGIAEEEHSMLQHILIPAMDTALSACWRGFDVEFSESWTNAEALIAECWVAAKALERDGATAVDTAFYEKVSNAYWQIFLLYRKTPESISKAVRALQKSTAVMDGRPGAELTGASVSLKCEILGALFVSGGNQHKGAESFHSAIRTAGASGLLNVLGERATNGETMANIINDKDKETASVGRALSGLVRMANGKQDNETAKLLRLDGDDLSVAARGVLLEWCFILALDITDNDGSAAREIGERLLELYDIDEMPVRRARIIGRLLGLAIDQPGTLNGEEVQGLGIEILDWAASPTVGLGADKSLIAVKDDMMANIFVGLAVCQWQERTADSDLVWKALRSWTALLDHSTDWDSLSRKMDDPHNVIKRLGMLVEFFGMKGESALSLATLELLLRFRNVERPANYDVLASLHAGLGLQYLRMGYSGKAGMSLGKAQDWLKKMPEEVSTATQLQWHLAYTEYLVTIGNLDKGLQYFNAASNIAEHDEELLAAKNSGAKVAKRVRVNRIIADAAYITSLIAFETGNTNESLLHARRCVRLNQRAWAGLEKLSRDSNVARTPGSSSLLDDMKALSLSAPKQAVHSVSHGALNLPTLWPLVSALHLGYMQAANVYRHLGMIRESLYFAEQALKTVEAVGATPSIDKTKVMIGDLKVRGGQLSEGSEILDGIVGSLGDNQATAALELALGNLEKLRGDFSAELKAYQRAEKAIDELLDIKLIQKLGKVDDGQDGLVGLVEQMTQLDVEQRPKTPSRRPRTPTRRNGRGASSKSRTTQHYSRPAPPKVRSVVSECPGLLKQKGDIARLIASSQAVQGDCDSALEILNEAAKLPSGLQEGISQSLVEARIHLQEAFSLVCSDPVLGVLQDSSISLPSAMHHEILNPSPAKKSTRKVAVKKTDAFIKALEIARDCLFSVHSKAMKAGSSTTLHRVASLLARIIVFLSAMTNMKGPGPEHPLFASYSLELHKGLATYREKMVVATEKLSATLKEDLRWPEMNAPHTKDLNFDASAFEFSTFQSEYVDIIPGSWAAVSVSLSEDHEELYISRFQAGRSQLMVRLPLKRHNSRDEYQEVFEYETGLKELMDIIGQSNMRTRQAKEMVIKSDRAAWWEAREALDCRLKELLGKIEQEWLGGFKGIFCQYLKNPALLARVKASLDKILAKHVPSRKKKKSAKVEIDYRIFELFIALGSPQDRDLDYELQDLLSFVIDILQFHGEGNAYDEIDFDSMVVEMKDTLTSYHEEATYHLEDMELEVDHTILILDKYVQLFPWESLPCLRGHSVSRLPSLNALRDRILEMRENSEGHRRPGYYVGSSSGTYILNPDSDLKRTQNMFENDLKALPGNWTGIVNRAPTEWEFEESLTTKNVVLYFGHGSGAHYIPAKNIRRLDHCAVTCLMGCSSGALKDSGEFEPYGMPTNYMIAGCPAVLANLWDVTDKDIDKFTKEVFEKWGLTNRNKSKSSASTRGKKSLVEAVTEARNACVMKYLNGAAPVVYGIPAYLSP